MAKLSRTERKVRTEIKKKTIRTEIFKVMNACAEAEKLNPVHVINVAIEHMIKQNPTESHLVRAVCAEIRKDPAKFCVEHLK